jgi:hypothetical protein
MPKHDVTGYITQRSLAVIQSLRERMQEKIPYGPLREHLTDKETRIAIQDLDPEVKRGLMQKVGPEEWHRMMEDLYGN